MKDVLEEGRSSESHGLTEYFVVDGIREMWV